MTKLRAGLSLGHQIATSCHKKSPLGGDKIGQAPLIGKNLDLK